MLVATAGCTVGAETDGVGADGAGALLVPDSAPLATATAFVSALPNCEVDPLCTSGELTDPLVSPGALEVTAGAVATAGALIGAV